MLKEINRNEYIYIFFYILRKSFIRMPMNIHNLSNFQIITLKIILNLVFKKT